jgi:hypothetical protein
MQRGDEWHWSLRLKTDREHLIGLISLLRKENQNRGFWMALDQKWGQATISD